MRFEDRGLLALAAFGAASSWMEKGGELICVLLDEQAKIMISSQASARTSRKASRSFTGHINW